MSTPKNHHFVSQVHLKNFFNIVEKKIYIYDKSRNNYYFRTTTKSLFSENELNSRYVNGEVDHSSIEKNLNDYFEKDFSKNTKIIKEFIIHRELTENVNNALIYFAKYGIIGDMRTPRFKKHIDDSIIEGLSPILQNCTPELQAQIDEMFAFKNQVNYSNTIDYPKMAEDILNLMGNLIFQILIPKKEDEYFIIPDFSAATVRAKINNYFNPDVEEIAYIGLPLTSKIYIHFHSEKLYKNKQIPPSIISYCSSEAVSIYNKANLDFCQDKIACENLEYLKRLIIENSTIA